MIVLVIMRLKEKQKYYLNVKNVVFVFKSIFERGFLEKKYIYEISIDEKTAD